MSQDNIYLIIYILLWAVLLFKYQKETKYFGAGSLLISSFLVYSVFAYLTYNNHDFTYMDFGHLKLFPFIYLFCAIVITMYPVLKTNETVYKAIEMPNQKAIDSISVIFILATIVQIPEMFSEISTGLAIMLADQNGANELYAMAHNQSGPTSGFGGISNLFSIIYNVFSDLGILFFFYYLSLPKWNRFILFGFIVAIIVSLLVPISQGLRTGVTMKLLTLVIAYVTMRRFLPSNVNKRIRVVGLSVMLGIGFLITLITISRFGNTTDGSAAFTLYYLGQAPLNFNEYGLDAGGIRYGDRTANTFKHLLLFPDVPNGIMATRTKYSNMLMDDGSFYTYIGDFTLDYGPIGAFIIFIVFSVIMTKATKVKDGVLRFHQLIALYFVMCVGIQGGFYLFNYSFTFNLVIIAFILAYYYFKSNSSQNKTCICPQ